MTAFESGFLVKMAQEGISPADARMIAEYVSARQKSDSMRDAIAGVSPLRRIASAAGGAGIGGLAGAGLSGGAELISRLVSKKPVATGEALDSLIRAARLGMFPGAFIGGVTGAVR